MRLVFAGTPQVAVPSLQRLIDSPHDVVGVITQPDARSGRGRKLVPSPIKQLAEQHDVPVLQPATLKCDDFAAQLEDLKPDLCPVVAYGQLVPQRILDIPTHGWVNLHFSLLPAWRGAAPVQHALMAGDEMTGAVVFQLETGLDTGPIYSTVTDQIHPDDTAGDILTRLADSGAELLAQTIDGIDSQKLQAVPQATHGISHAPRIMPPDACISWAHPALAIDRLIRGCNPAPGAWTTLDGQRFKIGLAEVAPQSPFSGDTAVGSMTVVDKHPVVATGGGTLILKNVQPAGKKMMSAQDWCRGLHTDHSIIFGGEPA